MAIESGSEDNFWEVLPIERLQMQGEILTDDKPKNADFELAEEKAIKAIQKHSMNIEGRERNSQIDEAYLLLGKARYFDQRYIPALDAFNFILYKYPGSDKINEARVWRERTNMRLGNDGLVIRNISKMLRDKKLKKQVYADANALLAESFLNVEQKDSAIAKLKIATKFTKRNNEKARYQFIIGQLYEELNQKDSALISYESVIKMNRKAERIFLMQAQIKKAHLFDYNNGDTTMFVKNYKKLIEYWENKPFLDILNYQLGVYYDKQNNQQKALQYYNASLKNATNNDYLIASDYRNIGNMYFNNAAYTDAAKYYDSTLTKLNPKTREYIHIEKVRKDLDEVILYEGLAERNDSILHIMSLDEKNRLAYFENYIEKLKKADEAKKIEEEKLRQKEENIARNTKVTSMDPVATNPSTGLPLKTASIAPPSLQGNQNESVFYFYNSTTLAFGKVEFKRIWGNRKLGGYWRVSSAVSNEIVSDSAFVDSQELDKEQIIKEEGVKEEYTTDYYLQQLPDSENAIDSIAKERNASYYQLGLIYKEKFKEYGLATAKLEQLLNNNPEEKLVLPTIYNLYKIYQLTDAEKAEKMKSRINSEYSDSRYALIINNPKSSSIVVEESADVIYEKLYKQYLNEEYLSVSKELERLIPQFSGEEIVSKFELLRASVVAKIQGLADYKNALQLVADNYPNTEEGKMAAEVLLNQIPLLEKMDFIAEDSKNWKIIYKIASADTLKVKEIDEKVKKFNAVENFLKLSVVFESYTSNESFAVIKGFNSMEYAAEVATTLKEDKAYKLDLSAIIISNENYKIIQIKKNLNSYLEQKNLK